MIRLTIVPALLATLVAQPSQGQGLDNLLELKDFTAHRAASSDPNGGNLDMRRIEPAQTLPLAELQGPAVITHIWFTLNYPSRAALRKMVFRIWFDDIDEPCVEAPLGDFFGLGHARFYAFSSTPLAVGTHGGLNSYWPMPFAKKARLTLTNEGAQVCPALYYQIDYRKLEKPPANDLHFFAAYRQAFPCQKEKHYVILDTDGGRGHYVGCNLSIEQKEDGWWGEGDMRIYVDGEKNPSIAGTGSEDDFGGAWCYSHEFSYAQFGAPLRARFNREGLLEHCTPDLRGKDLNQWRWPEAWKVGDLWNVYRYHLVDPVPFRKSILVNIEHGWINNERGDWYSSVAYWYQAGRPVRRIALPAVQDRTPAFLRPHDRGDGRWEGEDLADAAKPSAGEVLEAGMEFWGDLFSHQYALQWDARKPDDTLTLPFTITKPGRYRITVRPCRTAEGGTFRISVDNLPPTEPVNCLQPPPFPGLFDLVVAEADFTTGNHVLTFVNQTPNPKSKGQRLLLDKFQVSPAGSPQTQTSDKP